MAIYIIKIRLFLVATVSIQLDDFSTIFKQKHSSHIHFGRNMVHIEDTRYNFVSRESDIYVYIRFNNKIISEFNSRESQLVMQMQFSLANFCW